MTTFRAPFAVTQVQDTPTVAEVTVQQVSARGSATWLREQRFGATARFSAVAAFGVTAQFQSDINVSGRLLYPGLGAGLITSTVTVNEGSTTAVTAATLPVGAFISNMQLIRKAAMGTAGATVNVLIGDSSDDDRFGNLTNISSSSIFITTGFSGTCGLAMTDLAAAANVLIKTTAVSGTVSGGAAGAAGAGQSLFVLTWGRTL